MAKSKKELLAIRDESYRVPYAQVCRTCQHWHRYHWSDFGACRVVTIRMILHKETDPAATCDLWEGRSNDQ
jgi:hypothetical protein